MVPRLLSLLVVGALLAVSCSDAPVDQASTAADPTPVEGSTPPAAATTDEGADTTAEQTAEDDDAEVLPARLLPDPQRWVVVEDWSERIDQDSSSSGGFSGLQLDVAPLDESGVPQLSQRVALSYRLGPVEDFERQWGDASSMGEPVDFTIDDGVGRSVHNEQVGFAIAMVWTSSTFVTIQAQHTDVDVTELAQSLTPVEDATWTLARAGAEDQRLIAIESAMSEIGPVATADEPMPHWVLPAPWELQTVTDMTIWTAEQQTQRIALVEANQPSGLDTAPGQYRTWKYGFAARADEAARQFVPQISISAVVHDEVSPAFHPTNYDTISALGLDGVISPVGGSGTSAQLGTGLVRVNVRTTDFSDDQVREFLDVVEFASDNPLDGFVVNDPRFQPIALAADEQQPSNWHAWWEKPDSGAEAALSVWRLTVTELRLWLMNRGPGLQVPADVWETIASDGIIHFGSSFGQDVTYDVDTGLLMSMRGVNLDDLIPIELDDWIALAEPVNADPLNPR